MELIFEETKKAEEIIENGKVGKNPTFTLFLLGKYYKQKKKMKPKQIREELNKFMQEHYAGYISAQWEDIIENISKSVKNYNLIDLKDGISITKIEIEKIKSCDGIQYQKLLFTMLVYAKFGNLKSNTNNNWVNCEIPELFRIGKVTVKHKNDKYLMLNDLNRMGFIEYSNKNENLNLRLTFIDDSSSTVLFVKDGRELGYQYLKFIHNGKYTQCKKCNRIIKKTNNKVKFCHDCKVISDIKRKHDWYLGKKENLTNRKVSETA